MSATTQQAIASAPKVTAARAPAKLLQRKCLCAEQARLPDGEDERRRKPGSLQAKLAISQPGDRWEQEADRLAEAVVGGQGDARRASATGLQPRLLRQADPARNGSDAPEAVRPVLRSAGRPLEPGTRAFMEDGFGHDFGQVRIHADQQAAESARQMNALAYTVGRDLVFAEGQYAPDTSAGRKLLAHELAHTIQQGNGLPAVRRQAADLAVRGLPDERAGQPDFVYFDIDRPSPADNPPESALDSAEERKAEDKAHAAVAANDQEMSLYGFASEEGNQAHNAALVERRMTAVENVVRREGFRLPRPIHRNSRLACSRDKYDYRAWRVVEMQRGTAASTRVCNPSAAQPTACSPDLAQRITTVRDRALELINGQNGALARLDRYLQNQASDPGVQAALDRYFGNSHTVRTAQDVRDRVDAIRAFLQAMAPNGSVTFVCGTMEEPTCHTGSPANASRRLQRVTICPSFFDNPDYANRREEILIHEASHASSIPTRDRAYQEERVILFLSTQQALNNAQSLTQFIMDMNGQARPLGPTHPDVVSGCDPAHERLVREALAWAERWNTYAMFGTAQTYGNATNRTFMAPYHKAHFGRTDQAAIAGLYDRYRVMSDWFDRFYNVHCAPAGDPACSTARRVRWTLTTPATAAGGGPEPAPAAPAAASSAASAAGGSAQSAPAPSGAPPVSAPATSASPAGEIAVCPTFFSLSTLYDRVVEMHSGLAVNIPGITESISRSYARLAYNYKTQYWGVN